MIEYFYYFCEINNAIRIPAEGSDPGRPIHTGRTSPVHGARCDKESGH